MLMTGPQVTIIVKNRGKHMAVSCRRGQSILDALTGSNVHIDFPCAGKSTCGKCRIRVLEGDIAVSREDNSFFSRDELESGYRLACTAYPATDCTIELDIDKNQDYYIVTDADIPENLTYDKRDDSKNRLMETDMPEMKLGIGIDIGTTTIAMQLIDKVTGGVVDTYSALNSQRKYGADVISRIERANRGQGDELRQSIINDLKTGLGRWLSRKHSPDIGQIAIAGNTAMIHLLMGYSCSTLGVYPYTPVNIKTIYTTYAELLKDSEWNIPVVVFPGISAFIGGDIAAGMLACGFAGDERVKILIDLGTNGEMVIGNNKKILAASAAAGPAFEGGNITFGTGSIPGAICRVSIEDGKCRVKTINGKPPAGICGTGVIEAVAELLKAGFIDGTGLLGDDCFENGYPLVENGESGKIVLTQKDIREIQLAKAAIRAGLEVLLKRYGAAYGDIDTVYLAGGFGFEMDADKAMAIGLLPKEFKGRVRAVGNTALNGTVRYICDKNAEAQVALILEVTQEISLSNDEDFNGLYVKYMNFID